MGKFTSALEVLDTDLHVTLCFCDTEKAGKFRTSHKTGYGTIRAVEYWERVDLTVAIIDSDFVMERHAYYKDLGYGYSFEFIPHATLGKGNLVEENKALIGEGVYLGNEYARTY